MMVGAVFESAVSNLRNLHSASAQEGTANKEDI